MDQINATLAAMPEHERAMIGQAMQDIQVKSSLDMYFRTLDRCFDDCVNDLTTSKMMPKESTCMDNCFSRFQKYGHRVTMRFAEENAKVTEAAAAAATK